MKIIAGIDYSMTSPAICVHQGDEWKLENCHIHYLTDKKNFIGNFNFHSRIKLSGAEIKSYKSQTERFINISEWAMKSLNCFAEMPEFVIIEGYSYGSNAGRAFDIAENGGLLKYNLHIRDIPFDIPAPSAIKKFATGSGRANKEDMRDQFEKEYQISLDDLYGNKNKKKSTSPISDIIDSFYMAKLCFER